MVRRVRRAGLFSDEGRALRESLLETGVGTLIRLLLGDRPDAPAVWLRRGWTSPPLPVDVAHVGALVYLAVLSALDRFLRDQIMGGGWDPARGASVRTYFVNACITEYLAEYRRFCVAEQWLRVIPAGELIEFLDRTPLSIDPAHVVVLRDTIARAFLGVRDSLLELEMFRLTADGYTQAEVGAFLGLTAENVSTRMRRRRNSIRERCVDE